MGSSLFYLAVCLIIPGCFLVILPFTPSYLSLILAAIIGVGVMGIIYSHGSLVHEGKGLGNVSKNCVHVLYGI